MKDPSPWTRKLWEDLQNVGTNEEAWDIIDRAAQCLIDAAAERLAARGAPGPPPEARAEGKDAPHE